MFAIETPKQIFAKMCLDKLEIEPNDTIWCPFGGDGSWPVAAAAKLKKGMLHVSDADSRALSLTRMYQGSYAAFVSDFLNPQIIPPNAKWLVGLPPYEKQNSRRSPEEFVRTAFHLSSHESHIALLLPARMISGGSRVKFWRDHTPWRIFIPPKAYPGIAESMMFVWWDRNTRVFKSLLEFMGE